MANKVHSLSIDAHRDSESRRTTRLRWGFFLLLAIPIPLLHCGSTVQSGGVGGGASGPVEPVCPNSPAIPTVPAVHVCEAGEVLPPLDGSLSTRDTLIGENGTFTDHCQTCDTLVTYVCAISDDDPCNDICESSVTGIVVEKIITCPCADGRCTTGCPAVFDGMKIDAVTPSGITTLTDTTSAKSYECAKVTGAQCNEQPIGAQGKVALVDDFTVCALGKGAFEVRYGDVLCSYEDCAPAP